MLKGHFHASMAPQTSKSSQITFSRCLGCSPDGACIPFPTIGIMLNIWRMCENVFGGHHHCESLPNRGMIWWYDTMILMLVSFNHGSDQSLPPELAKHDPLDRPQVVIGASITVCDLVYVFSTKCPRSVRGGEGGGKIDDLMVLLGNVPQASKSRQSLF